MVMMTEQQIEDALQRTDRWGVNSQPYLEDALAFLLRVQEKCGLQYVNADDATLEFKTERPLTPSLAYEMAVFMEPDLPEEIGDKQTLFVLWWD